MNRRPAGARVDFELERENARNRRAGRAGIMRRIRRDLTGSLDPLVQIEAEVMATNLLTYGSEQLRGAASMGAHSVLPALADLETGRGQLDQCLEHVG